MSWFKRKPKPKQQEWLLWVDVSDAGAAWTDADTRALRAFLTLSDAGVKLVRILKANVVANALGAGHLDDYAQGLQRGRSAVIGEILGFAVPVADGQEELPEGL